MKVYFVGSYGRRETLLSWARELEGHGIEVTSRWLRGEDDALEDGGMTEEQSRRIAGEDLDDLARATHVVVYVEAPCLANMRGGRHVEYGIAIGFAQRILLVGDTRAEPNVFYHLDLPEIERWPDWAPARERLIDGRIAEGGVAGG